MRHSGVATLLGLAVIITGACGTSRDVGDTTASPSPTATSGAESQDGNLPIVELAVADLAPDQWNNYIHIEHPVVDGLDDDVEQKVNAALDELFGVDGPLALPEDAGGYEGIFWQEDASFTVGLLTPVLLSIRMENYVFTGGAHGAPGTVDVTFDLSTGDQVDAMDLLDPSAREALSPRVRAQLDATLDQVHDAGDDVLLVSQAWGAGFDDGGRLQITFEAYGIGPYSIGMPTVAFTYGQLDVLGLVPEDGLYERAIAMTEDVAVAEDDAPSQQPAAGEDDETAVAHAVEAHLADDAACAGEGPEVGADGTHHVIDFAASTVVFVQCFSGAYQSQYEVLGWDGDALFEVAVELWVEGEVHEGSMILGYPSADGEILTNVEKFRGPGDCGIASRWTVEDASLRLQEVKARDCDDEGEPVGAEDWPVVWTA